MAKFRPFTALGDDGQSSLLGRGRFSKSDRRFEILGTLDECSAVIGVAKSLIDLPEIKEILTQIQRNLYQIMGEISITTDKDMNHQSFSEGKLTEIEEIILKLNEETKLPDGFVIPGDTPQQAYLDLARTVVRRAERRIIPLYDSGELENVVIRKYINRLSSLLYQMELSVNAWHGQEKPTMAKEK